MDMLRRSLAPITDGAWEAIDDQARSILKGNLSGRSVVDFSGPHGWELGAVNLGRVTIPPKQTGKAVQWGVREVLPLVEIRVPFRLSQMELDSIERGAKDADLSALENAAEEAAIFEEKAVYSGFKNGKIEGIIQVCPHKPIDLSKRADTYQEAVESAVVTIQKAGIGGPYDLVLGTVPFQILSAGDAKGYPVRRRVQEVIGGSIRWSPAIQGGLVVSRRGGDYEFTLGQDFSIGYWGHDKRMVDLYITESFAFRVIEPRAAVELKMGKG